MVKPALDDHWRNRIFSLLENEPGVTDGVIAAQLQKEAELQDRDDYPAHRTVNKYRKKWKVMPETELQRFRFFYWPESMGTEEGDLPWSAGAAALELLRIHHILALGRPSMRLARWFCRVTEAAPDLPAQSQDPNSPDRWTTARLLAAWESLGGLPDNDKRGIESYLAYAPWRNRENKEKYEAARQTSEEGGHPEPIPPYPRVHITAPEDGELNLQSLEDFMGVTPTNSLLEQLKLRGMNIYVEEDEANGKSEETK